MLWRCRMQLDRGDQVEVYAAKVPLAWRTSEAIEEPAGAMAFFLSSHGSEAGCSAVFLSDRMAWYPATYLGRLGMDVGLLDDVRVEPPPKKDPAGPAPEIDWESRKLTSADHECFYQSCRRRPSGPGPVEPVGQGV